MSGFIDLLVANGPLQRAKHFAIETRFVGRVLPRVFVQDRRVEPRVQYGQFLLAEIKRMCRVHDGSREKSVWSSATAFDRAASVLPRPKLPQDPCDVETNASIAEHRKQVKENAASAAASKSRHGIDCETGPRHDDFGRECDRYICNGPRDTESRSFRRGRFYEH